MKSRNILLTWAFLSILICATVAQDGGAQAGANADTDKKATQEIDPGVKKNEAEPPLPANNAPADSGKPSVKIDTAQSGKLNADAVKAASNTGQAKPQPEVKKAEVKIDKSKTDSKNGNAKKEELAATSDKSEPKADQPKAENIPKQADDSKNGQPEPGIHKAKHEADQDAQQIVKNDLQDQDDQDDQDDQGGQDDQYGQDDDNLDARPPPLDILDDDDDQSDDNHDAKHVHQDHPGQHQNPGGRQGYHPPADSQPHVQYQPQSMPPPERGRGYKADQPVHNDDDDDIVDDDDDTLADQQHVDSDSFMSEWEEHMSDFVPEDLFNLELDARDSEHIIENVDHLPSRIRGAYFVSSHDEQTIDLTITDPNKKIIFRRYDKSEGFFYFDANQTGEYVFWLSNRKWAQDKTITFALHCGNSSENLLTSKEVDPISVQMHNASQALKELQAETIFAYRRQETHYRSKL